MIIIEFFRIKAKIKLIYIFIFIFGTYLGCDSSIGPGAHTFNPGPILFHSSKDGVNNLYSMNDDGTDVKQLTRFDLSASRAIWSPDGERIAFTRSLTKDDFDFVHGIFIMNADGTGLKQVTFPPIGYFRNAGDGCITWSPDSKKIAFCRARIPEVLGQVDNYVINLESGEIEQITGIVDLPHARDGAIWVMEWIEEDVFLVLFINKETTKGNLGYLDIKNNIIQPITHPDEAIQSHALSPDGKKIAYTKRMELYIMDSDGTNSVKLIEREERKIFFPRVWSPENDRILLARKESPGAATELMFMYSLYDSSLVDITPSDFRGSRFRVTSWKRR